VSHNARSMERRRLRARDCLRFGRILRNANRKNSRRNDINVNWLAGFSLYLRNLWAFKHVAKPEDVK
jgi:hypothetical protein